MLSVKISSRAILSVTAHPQQGAHGAHSHSTLVFFSSVRRVSLHLPMQMHLLLSSGRSSYFRMVFCSFHFLPIFLSLWEKCCTGR